MANENPLTSLRLMIGESLTTFQPLVDAVGGAHNIQIWDRPLDIRGDLSDAETGSRRLQMAPEGGRWAFNASSGAVDFERRFMIEMYSDSTTDAAPPEYLEWLVIIAMAFLWEGLYPETGSPLVVPEPLIIDSIGVVEAKEDRDPLGADTEKWTGVCDVVVIGRVERRKLKEWVNP
ncbi:MAG: hypothetical protein HS101_16150 [Planctomycetia bacterium]|jgi:hypothetical protein|nr:hypothetical protein [Planctomycetia bacterium]MCC7315120.1 hypothetical protein [Planctomycetota bacterium]OQZ05542.1 MAG: hypothetical protein B6D36_09620 [Planctomycetes bacterium UTPLA1]